MRYISTIRAQWAVEMALLAAISLAVGCGGALGASGSSDGNGSSDPWTDETTTAAVSSSSTMLRALSEGGRVLIMEPGAASPVMWFELSNGDEIVFAYQGNKYTYVHTGQKQVDLDPNGTDAQLLVGGRIGSAAAIGLPAFRVNGTTEPYVLILDTADPDAPAFIFSACDVATCANGPSDGHSVTASNDSPLAIDGDIVIRFRKDVSSQGISRTNFALNSIAATTNASSSDPWAEDTASSDTTTTTTDTTTSDPWAEDATWDSSSATAATTNTTTTDPAVYYADTTTDTGAASSSGDSSGGIDWTKWLMIGGGVLAAVVVGSYLLNSYQESQTTKLIQEQQKNAALTATASPYGYGSTTYGTPYATANPYATNPYATTAYPNLYGAAYPIY